MADGLYSQNQVTSNTTTSDLPAWYQQYTQNLANTATGLASNLNAQPLPAASVAGFNPDQVAGFDATRQNQGAWTPQLNTAENANAGIAGMFGTTASADPNAPTNINPALNWSETYQKYMSPYTSAVVDNIARLGKRNWEENIMPGVNSAMIGSGQFGSTRNADILTRAGLSANQDILGAQATALESGYNKGADIYNQQQTLGLNAMNTMSDNAAQLAQLKQNMGITDVAELQKQGALQQALQQKGYDTAFSNAQLARTDPWTQLSNVTGALSSLQLPKSSTVTESKALSGSGGVPPTATDSLASGLTALAGVLR